MADYFHPIAVSERKRDAWIRSLVFDRPKRREHEIVQNFDGTRYCKCCQKTELQAFSSNLGCSGTPQAWRLVLEDDMGSDIFMAHESHRRDNFSPLMREVKNAINLIKIGETEKALETLEKAEKELTFNW
jgi:hypothetical protein